MRIAWLTDTHLNFVDEGRRRRFVGRLAAQAPDAVLVSGDIADGWTVVPALELLAARLACPTYFVLGNHDFYGRGVAAVRSDVRAAVRRAGGERLVYLSDAGVARLGPNLAVVGHDGWADGRDGDYAGSAFRTNDFVHIQDFQVFGDGFGAKEQRLRLMQHLAEEAAAHFAHVLPVAAGAHAHVIAVTHVPPFAAASVYRGRPSGPDALPFYSSRRVGEAILAAMEGHPACHVTVLAGHTHAACRATAAPNVEVRTAAAAYGRPRVAGLFTADDRGLR